MNKCFNALCAMLCSVVFSCPAGADHSLPAPWIQALSENMDWLCGGQVEEGVPAEVYFWVRPDAAGISCVEYRVVLDSWYEEPPYGGMFLIASPPNPAALFVVGTPVDSVGTVICFPECQEEFFWVHKLVFIPAFRGAFVCVDIAPHGQSGEVRAVSCTGPDNPYINLYYYMWDWSACIGGTCPGIEETSWGAIKGMYK